MKRTSLNIMLVCLFLFGIIAQGFAATGGKNGQKSKVIYLTKAEFLTKVANYERDSTEWKYLGDKPALIDFYADWCGPCRKVAPILDELSEKYDGQIYIYKIDTDAERELAADFGIRSIPSLLFVPVQGQPQMAQGALSKADFEKAIDGFLLQKTTTNTEN